MPDFFAHVLFLIYEMLRAPIDALLGVKNRRYTVALHIAAPKTVTWAVASSHSIRLEGMPPIELQMTEDPDRANTYTGQILIGDRALAVAYRVLDERPGEAMSLEILRDESAPECCPGDDYVCAFTVTGDDQTSLMTSQYDVTHRQLTSRFLLPIAAIQNVRRIRYNAELKAGSRTRTTAEKVKDAVITGLLTFASFLAMFGPSAAVMLLVLILIHEIGHILAMRWVGMPIKGMYFVPFFGGVAVAADRFRTEGERGLIALMGPGFSVLTTAVLLVLARENDSEMLRELAFMSAMLNGFNLLPILPLDGGHIAQSLLSRLPPVAGTVFHAFASLLGIALALYIESYILLVMLLLLAPFLFNRKTADQMRLPALSNAQWALLSVASVAVFTFYAAVAVDTLRREKHTTQSAVEWDGEQAPGNDAETSAGTMNAGTTPAVTPPAVTTPD
ncbi:MAG: metalloprotease [Hyphomicrobium sp.]